jgi:hypothetical protein
VVEESGEPGTMGKQLVTGLPIFTKTDKLYSETGDIA